MAEQVKKRSTKKTVKQKDKEKIDNEVLMPKDKNVSVLDDVIVDEIIPDVKQVDTIKKIKKPLKLKDDFLLTVKNKSMGKLVFINKRTQDKFVWQNNGDTELLTVSDIRSMRNTEPGMFTHGYLSIENIIEEGYEDYTIDEIYKALLISNHIKNAKADLHALVALGDINGIKSYISSNAQNKSITFEIAALVNKLIEDGELADMSLSKFNELESLLGIKLTTTGTY